MASRRSCAPQEGGLPTLGKLETPVIWDYFGTRRYLQACICKSVASFYASKFGKITSSRFCEVVARDGHINLLEWARTAEFPVWNSEDICVASASGGQKHVLLWLRDVAAIDWTSNNGTSHSDSICVRVCNACARKGHLDLLKWLVHHAGCAPREEGTSMCVSACSEGHIHVLDWLKGYMGSPIDFFQMAKKAAMFGKVEVLEWINIERLLQLPALPMTRPFGGTILAQLCVRVHLSGVIYVRSDGCMTRARFSPHGKHARQQRVVDMCM